MYSESGEVWTIPTAGRSDTTRLAIRCQFTLKADVLQSFKYIVSKLVDVQKVDTTVPCTTKWTKKCLRPHRVEVDLLPGGSGVC